MEADADPLEAQPGGASTAYWNVEDLRGQLGITQLTAVRAADSSRRNEKPSATRTPSGPYVAGLHRLCLPMDHDEHPSGAQGFGVGCPSNEAGPPFPTHRDAH